MHKSSRPTIGTRYSPVRRFEHSRRVESPDSVGTSTAGAGTVSGRVRCSPCRDGYRRQARSTSRQARSASRRAPAAGTVRVETGTGGRHGPRRDRHRRQARSVSTQAPAVGTAVQRRTPAAGTVRADTGAGDRHGSRRDRNGREKTGTGGRHGPRRDRHRRQARSTSRQARSCRDGKVRVVTVTVTDYRHGWCSAETAITGTVRC